MRHRQLVYALLSSLHKALSSWNDDCHVYTLCFVDWTRISFAMSSINEMGHRQMVFLQRLFMTVPWFKLLGWEMAHLPNYNGHVYKYIMCVCTPGTLLAESLHSECVFACQVHCWQRAYTECVFGTWSVQVRGHASSSVYLTVIHCDILWYTVIYCVYCSLLWYTVVYCTLLWYCDIL